MSVSNIVQMLNLQVVLCLHDVLRILPRIGTTYPLDRYSRET